MKMESNDAIKEIKEYMETLGYPKDDMDASIALNIDQQGLFSSVADISNFLCLVTRDKMSERGFIFNYTLYSTYKSSIQTKEDICSFSDFLSRFCTNVKERLMDKGYSEEIITAALDGKTVTTLSDAETFVDNYLKRLEEQEANRQRQLALDKQKDYISDVYDYIHTKNVSVVHPRELADEFFNSLTPSEKEQYGNNPTYAVHCCLEDTRLQEALSRCLARFNHSKMVDKVIDDYCNEHYPDEQNRSMLIDRLAASCPSVLKSEDVRANAYQAIIGMKNTDTEMTQDVNNDHVSVKQAAANFAAKFLNGESMSVARDTCSSSRKVAQQASETLTHNTSGTTEDAVKEKQESDPEWAKEVKEQIAQYQKTISDMQKQIQQQDKLLNAQVHQQQAQRYINNSYGYNTRDNMYGYNNQYGYNNHAPRFPMWLIGIGVNLIFMLIVYFINVITDLPIALGQVGLLISAIGYPMLGRHKDAKRFLIIGYGMFIIWLLWTVLL